MRQDAVRISCAIELRDGVASERRVNGMDDELGGGAKSREKAPSASQRNIAQSPTPARTVSSSLNCTTPLHAFKRKAAFKRSAQSFCLSKWLVG